MVHIREFPDSFMPDTVALLEAVGITDVSRLAERDPDHLAASLDKVIARNRANVERLTEIEGLEKTFPTDTTLLACEVTDAAKRLLRFARGE